MRERSAACRVLLVLACAALAGGAFGRAWAADAADAADVVVAAAPTAAAIVAPNPVFDFGAVPTGSVVEHEFAVENRSEAPVSIVKVRGSCGCTAAQVSVDEIPPGGTGGVRVRFDTRGRSGPQSQAVYITTNAAATPLIICRLTGTVEPVPVAAKAWCPPSKAALGAESGAAAAVAAATATPVFASASTGEHAAPISTVPARLRDAVAGAVLPPPANLASSVDTLDFGRVWTDESPQRDFSVTNTGDTPLRILAVTDDCACFSTSVDRRELPPGASARIRLQLRPGMPRRDLRQTVLLLTDAADAGPFRLPVQATVVPRLEATPSAVRLPPVAVGEVAEQLVRLASVDGAPFAVVRVECPVDGMVADVLPATGSTAVDLRLRFTAARAAAPVSGFVRIVTDRQSAGGVVTLPVSGSTISSGGAL